MCLPLGLKVDPICGRNFRDRPFTLGHLSTPLTSSSDRAAGDEFIRRARQIEQVKDIPVILTTAHPPEHWPAAAAIFIKPIRPETLLALLRQLFG